MVRNEKTSKCKMDHHTMMLSEESSSSPKHKEDISNDKAPISKGLIKAPMMVEDIEIAQELTLLLEIVI